MCTGVIGFAAGRFKQIRNPPGDRGRGVDPVHRPRRQANQPVHQQRVVGTSQHHGVGAGRGVVAGSDKTWRKLRGYRFVADLNAAQCRFGECCQIRRAHQRHLASPAEIAPCFVGDPADTSARTDTIVLACTHYPLLLERLVRLAPWPVNWIDPAPAIARRVSDLLGPSTGEADYSGAEMIFTSGRPPMLSRTLMPFFGGRVPA